MKLSKAELELKRGGLVRTDLERAEQRPSKHVVDVSITPLPPTHKEKRPIAGGTSRQGRTGQKIAALDPSSPAAALDLAGIPGSVSGHGARRKTGLGITVPLMAPRPGLVGGLDAYASTPLPDRARLSKLSIVVSADHGAYGRAEAAAVYLRSLGVGRVRVIAPEQGQRMNYGVSTAAALSMLEAGEADRVISFCGNGLGALDIANLFAANPGGRTQPPTYGDNLWSVVDGQKGAEPANVLCLGARLLNTAGDPMRALLKAFLDDPTRVEALAGEGLPQHGASSILIDPKPDRISNRTLGDGVPFAGPTIQEQIRLSDREREAIASRPVVVYSDGSARAIAAQKKLMQWLPPSVRLEPWDGASRPAIAGGVRAILLSEHGAPFAPARAYGFWEPSEVADAPVHRAAHWRSVASFVERAPPGPISLDLPLDALSDRVTGGRDLDVLKLLSKVFLLQRAPEAKPPKALYGEAVQFVQGYLGQTEMPRELEGWRALLEDAREGAR
ncbi:MAG: hypothetical protein IT384_07865 [Deltaproteobacteria bacterium]|nr:hypothetical protein [Deltaproteobacteria bacterium]